MKAIRSEAPLWNSAAAPASNARLSLARFNAETNGGGRTESGEWRNADVAVVQVLSGEIRQGILATGDRFPSLAALARRFGASTNTVRRALLILVEDALVLAEGSGTARRYFVAPVPDDSAWRPPPLPDGRDSLEELLSSLRSSDTCLAAAAKQIGLHLSIVRGWGQRHPWVAKEIDQAMSEGKRRHFSARFRNTAC